MSFFARPQGSASKGRGARDPFDAVLRASEIASSAASLPEAVQAVARHAVEVFAADRATVMLLDEARHELVLVAAAGAPPGVQLGYRVAATDGIAGRVLATGKALRLEDVDRAEYPNQARAGMQIAGSLVAPLRSQGRTIGVLSLAVSDEGHTFTEDDRRLAQMFADQVAGLIQRTRLHEQAERRSSDLASLVEASKNLMGSLELEPLLQTALDGALRLLGGQHGFLCLFDRTSGAVTTGVFQGLDKPTISAVIARPEVQGALATLEAVPVQLPERPFVVVGLRTSQGTAGLVAVAAPPDALEERAYVLRAYAQQASGALGAAELFGMVQRKESELTSIIQSVPNPIVLADRDGKIVSLNPSAEQLFGLSSSFCTGRPVEGALGEETLEHLLVTPGDQMAEVTYGVPPRYLKVRAADVRSTGAPSGRVLVIDDITPEKEIAQTQHDFVAMIGHELRTPLTIVKGFTKMLLKRIEKATPEQTAEALQTIDQKANQLERLIEDLLYVSGIEAREATLRVDEIDLRVMVQEVAEEVLADHPEREIKLELPSQLPWRCDETKTELVLRHLIDNALKYSSAPDPVVVRGIDRGNEVQIDVIDRGMGIVSSDIPHIFERFRQLDGSATREHGGTGVGLYLCAQLMKVQDGRIWVDSTWGKGSTFSFSLPKKALRNEVVGLRGTAARSAG